MTAENLNKNLDQIKYLLAAYAGATFVMLLLTLGDLPLNNFRFRQDEVLTIDAWFGLWLVLQIGSPVPGIVLLVSRAWRDLESNLRNRLAFGYFLVAWFLLLAFDLRNSILIPYILHMITFIFGIFLLLGYLVSRRRQSKSEDMFP